MNKFYVDKKINVYRDKEAQSLLQDNNYKRNIVDINDGVINVRENDWIDAQEYELLTWKNSCTSNDRNDSHMFYLDNYSFLESAFQDKDINIIELGCGPFTNLRLILPKIKNKINNIDLLDPLILNYVSDVSGCQYKNSTLGDQEVNLISSSIEDFNTDKKYDLIVLINVLEHCKNIPLIFDKIKSLLGKNGILIFGEGGIREDCINDFFDSSFDAGHPIQISYNKLKQYLEDFYPIYLKEISGIVEYRVYMYGCFKVKNT